MEPRGKWIIFAIQLLVLIQQDRTRSMANSFSEGSVTLVVANLEAINTTTMLIEWNTEQKPSNITIYQFDIIVDQLNLNISIVHDSSVTYYSYNITRLRPGEYCNATLMVNYWLVTTEAPINTEVTVTTQGPVTTQAPDVQQDPIDLYSNTYPEAPSDVTLVSRDNQSLTFSWYQVGEADSCTILTNSSDKHTGCSGAVTEDGNMTATLSNLQVAGMNYTVTIVAVRGSLDSKPAITSARTRPPNPSRPNCLSVTKTSILFEVPHPEGEYEIDGYDVSVKSLIDDFPNVTEKSFFIPKDQLNRTISDLVPGVTYNIEVISSIDGLKSDAKNSSNCTTELDQPLGTEVVNVTERSIFVQWQKPAGYFEGFKLTCTTASMGKNDSQTVFPETVTAGYCEDLTPGALYTVYVTSILATPPGTTSEPSQAAYCATVPLEPTTISETAASGSSLQLKIDYGHTENASQCTDFEVSLENETITVPYTGSPALVSYDSLEADREYISSTYSISDYTDQVSGDSLLLQRSTNAKNVNVWTVAPSIVSISQLDHDPWSLLVKFDPVKPNDHVSGYAINVKRVDDVSLVKSIHLTCDEKPVALTLNCEGWTTSENITCGSGACPTADPLTTAPAVDTVTPTSLTTAADIDSVTPTSRARHIPSRETEELSICYNITGLKPYIDYNVSIQAVNPGGCSVVDSFVYLKTAESTPGCVDITEEYASFDSVTLTWSEPDEPNGVVIGYVVMYNLTNGTESVTSNVTNVEVASLDPYDTYCLTVAAETSLGLGEYLNCPMSTTCVDTQIGPPFEPILTLRAINSTAMNVSWELMVEKSTGPETYFNVTIIDSVDPSLTNRTVHLPGFNNRSVVFYDLDEYWNYTVSIVAYTIDVNEDELTMEGESKTELTMESIPGRVQNVNASSLSTAKRCFEIGVSWNLPDERERNGKITGYRINWSQLDGSSQTHINTTERYAVLNVEPNGKSYNITVEARTIVGLGELVSAVVESTGYCGPHAVSETDMFLNSSNSKSDFSFVVAYEQSYFTDNPNGPVVARALLVAEGDGELQSESETGSYSLYNESKKWKDAHDQQTIPEYRPTPDYWLNGSTVMKLRSKRETKEYVVGENKDCENNADSYCNGPLPSGKSFRVRAIICTQTAHPEACFETKYAPFVYGTNVVEQTSGSMAWIAGVIIPIILIIILIIIFLYWRRRKNKDRLNQSTSSGSSRTDIPMQKPIINTTSPIQLYEFSSRVEDMHRNSDLDFNDEYQKIQDGSPKHPWRAAELADNRIKNRFVNILPFDHSRVRILAEDGYYEGKTDFINANYIPNRKNDTEFVACQGPLPKTVDDFWQMVWEQHSLVIVMLTNLREKGRERCALYWPDEVNQSTKFWQVNVLLLKETVDTNYTIRKLLVTKGDERREVIQYHYTTWPDFGVPDNHREVLNFVRQVRRQADSSNQHPVTVHCSAGVGRTGTFIALDQLLREIAGADSIDIYGLVFHLRNYRCYMVQTEVQYVFIHDCMKIVINEMVNCVYENYNQGYDDSDDSFKEEPIYANQSEGYAHHDNVKVQMNGKNHHG